MFAITAGCTTDLGLATVRVAGDHARPVHHALVVDRSRLSSGAFLSCADAHAATVELDADDQTFQWPCTDGKGATKSLPPATYNVKIKLLDATGTVLSITPTMPVAGHRRPAERARQRPLRRQ